MRYDNECANCGAYLKEWSFATDRQGHLPIAFCSSLCTTAYNQKKKMADNKNFVPFKKGLTTDQLTNRMSKARWSFPSYIVERKESVS